MADVAVKSPLQYLDTASNALRDMGLLPEKIDPGPMNALLEKISDLDQDKIALIARTLGQTEVFNEVVREQTSKMEIGERYQTITNGFNSIRDDSKRLVDQVADGKIDIFERGTNMWMKIARGDIGDRFEKIKKTVRDAVHFLDNVIDMNQYPLPQIAQMAKGNRKIGLGVMGLAHFFIRLGIPYNSPKALEVAKGLMSFIQHQARERSMELAQVRGVFPNFLGSVYSRNGMKLRNATLTTIAPTGTLSLIANCSSGIEPLFAIHYFRRALEGMEFEMTDPLFLELGEKEGFLSQDLMKALSEGAGLRELPNISQSIKELFVTAFEVPPLWHVKIQAAFQEYTDNAVSKTINFPRDATKDQVKEAYRLAYREKCKGITIYRSGSKAGQVLACGTKQVC